MNNFSPHTAHNAPPPQRKEKVQAKQKAYLLTNHEVTTMKLPPRVFFVTPYCSPSGFSVHGILQARTLEWVGIPFSRGSSWPRDWTWVSHTAGRFSLSEPAGKCQSSLIILEWAVFPPISSEIISAIKNGYFQGELSYYFIISTHKSVECHHSSEEAHLQTQAHSLGSDPRWQCSVSAFWAEVFLHLC